MEYGMDMKFQKMNQEEKSLKIVCSGKDKTYEQNLHKHLEEFSESAQFKFCK